MRRRENPNIRIRGLRDLIPLQKCPMIDILETASHAEARKCAQQAGRSDAVVGGPRLESQFPAAWEREESGVLDCMITMSGPVCAQWPGNPNLESPDNAKRGGGLKFPTRDDRGIHALTGRRGAVGLVDATLQL